jgi:hypothetical protein
MPAETVLREIQLRLRHMYDFSSHKPAAGIRPRMQSTFRKEMRQRAFGPVVETRTDEFALSYINWCVASSPFGSPLPVVFVMHLHTASYFRWHQDQFLSSVACIYIQYGDVHILHETIYNAVVTDLCDSVQYCSVACYRV